MEGRKKRSARIQDPDVNVMAERDDLVSMTRPHNVYDLEWVALEDLL